MNLKRIFTLFITCLATSIALGQSYNDTLIAPAPPPPPPLPCPSTGCNLICHGNFENTSPLYYNYFVPQRTSSHMVHKENSIDIYTVSPAIKVEDFQLSGSGLRSIMGGWRLALYPCAFTPSNITAPEGNSFLGMTGYEVYSGSARTYSEATYLKLRRPLVKDSVYKLMYWARRVTNDTSCVGTMNLEIRGSLMPPCHPDSFTPIYVNTSGGTSIPNCSYYYSQLISTPTIGSTSWVEYTIMFTANAPIAHLILTIPQSNRSDTKGAYAYFDDFRIFENKPINLNYTTHSCGQSGHATLSASGGYAPYSYLWPDGVVASQRYNLAVGKYPVTVTDAQGCEKVDTVKIDSSTYDFRLTAIVSNPRCKGGSDGSILVLPQGNTGPYTYAWAGGLPPVFYQYSLAPGTYKVIVRDKNNCQLTDEYDIIDTLQSLDIKTKTIVTPYICGGAKGSIRVRPQGGVKPYNVIWPDGRTDTARTDLLPGHYIVQVMDNNHCNKYDTFIIPKVGIYGNAKIILTPIYHCTSALARVNSTITQGEAPFTYLWSNGSTQSFADNISTTTKPKVYITYTETTGCINRDSIQLQHYIDIGTGTAYPTSASAVGVSKPFHHITANAFRERFRLHGVFTINQSVTFTKCDILARPGSKILANMNLNLDSTTIRTCVDTLWKGIEVAANAAINMKQSTIEDALYAVESNSQRLDYFDNNIFRNNYLGIFYPPRANTSTVRTSYNTFTNNRFLSTVGRGSIKNAFPGAVVNTVGNLQHSNWYIRRAWAGMAICDFRHFYFSNNTFSNMINGALFYNVTDPRSTKNIFENMLFENVPILNGYPNGIGLYIINDKPEVSAWLIAEGHGKNHAISGFKNCRVGLYTAGNVTIHHLNQTRMTNVYEGVYSLVGNASHIRNTNIQAQHRGIYFLPGSTGSVATAPSFCYDSNQISISGNTNLSNGIEVIYTGGSIGTFAVGSFIYTGIANSTVTMNGRSGYGVMVQNLKRALVNKKFGNQPFVRTTTIDLNAPSISLGGINLTNSQNTDVVNNLIRCQFSSGRTAENTSQTPAGLFPVGIYMNMSQDTLRCNSIMNLRTGMRFTGRCNNSQIERTRFFNHTNGLRLDDLSSLVSQTNKGNTWLGSYSGGFAAENAQTSRSTIFYFGSLSPAKFRAAPYKPFNLFQPNTGTDNDACNGTIGNVSGGSNSNGQVSLRDIILNGDLSFERFETPLIYQNEESLYEELKPLEESLPDTSVELAFIHRLDTLSIGAFYDLEQQALAYSMKSTADSAMLDQSNAARDSLEKQLSYYDAIRANQADSLTDSLRLEIDTAMAFLLDQLAPIQALLDEYQANAHTRLQWQCDTLLSMTRLVEVLDTPTQLKKRFYELYFRTVARGSRLLTTGQQDSFRQLAQLCPLLEPDAVYRSRAIMRLYEDTVFYDDALICGEAGMEYKSTKPRKLKPQITCMLSPNPAKDYSMINFSTNPTSSVTITISDIQGRVIKSEQVTISDNQYRVNTAHWIEGIYLIRVVHENLVIFDGKLKINPSN